MDPQERIPDHKCPYLHGPIGREVAEAHIRNMGCSDGLFLVRRKDKFTMALTLAFKKKISHLLIETGTFYTLKINDVFDRALCLDELIQQMRLTRQGWTTPLETPITRTMIKTGQDAIGLAKWKSRAPVAAIDRLVSTERKRRAHHATNLHRTSDSTDGVLSTKRGPRGLPHGILEEADAGPSGDADGNELLTYNPDEMCRIRSDTDQHSAQASAGDTSYQSNDLYITLDDSDKRNPRGIVPAVSGVRLFRDQPDVAGDAIPASSTTVDFIAPQYTSSGETPHSDVRGSFYCGVEPADTHSADALYDDIGLKALSVAHAESEPLYDSNPNAFSSEIPVHAPMQHKGSIPTNLNQRTSVSSHPHPRSGTTVVARHPVTHGARPVSTHGAVDAQRVPMAAMRHRSASVAARPVSASFGQGSRTSVEPEHAGARGGGISRRRVGSIVDERRAFQMRMSTKGNRPTSSIHGFHTAEHGSPADAYPRRHTPPTTRNIGFAQTQSARRHTGATTSDMQRNAQLSNTKSVNAAKVAEHNPHGMVPEPENFGSDQHQAHCEDEESLYAQIDDADGADDGADDASKSDNCEQQSADTAKREKKSKKRLGNLFKSFKKGRKSAGEAAETAGLPVRSYTDIKLHGFIPVDHGAKEQEVVDAIREAHRLNESDQVPILNAELSITPTTVMMCTITNDELMSTELSSVTYVYTDSANDTHLVAFIYANGGPAKGGERDWECGGCFTWNIATESVCEKCSGYKPAQDGNAEADSICVVVTVTGDTGVGLKKKFELSMTAANLPMEYDSEDTMRTNGAVEADAVIPPPAT
eukprot:m.1208158 g.1208158  ORF g.1208158 m.1208158 type:complete len:815 (-) comp24588_c0_seq43:1327-3771(-)